jgi:hypothetical protein
MEIYDNGGDTIDRYTIFLSAGSDEAIGASDRGEGFYQHIEAKRGRHLGKKIPFTSLSTELRHKLAEE